MSNVATKPRIITLADLLDQLGSIAPARVRFDPLPGTATLKDLIAVSRSDDRLYELVDRTLVEKAVGWREALLASILVRVLGSFVRERNLGIVTGPDGLTRLKPGLVRGPDVAFFSWKRFPERKLPDDPYPELVPDLAVEVLSKSNTKKEMARKRREYFKAGVQLVWEIDPAKRSATVFKSATDFDVLDDRDTLSGGELLPGFSFALSDLFDEAEEK